MIYYLEHNKLPIFKSQNEEKKFFSELNYWKIPIHISSKNILKFNPIFCPYYFTFDKKCQLLTKNNLSKGILEKNRNDQVDLHSIINKVKNTLKEKEIEQEKEEKRRKIIANTPYL